MAFPIIREALAPALPSARMLARDGRGGTGRAHVSPKGIPADHASGSPPHSTRFGRPFCCDTRGGPARSIHCTLHLFLVDIDVVKIERHAAACVVVRTGDPAEGADHARL
jgi:hypothetical protein